jgi:Tfp pilus assembly protein PilV
MTPSAVFQKKTNTNYVIRARKRMLGTSLAELLLVVVFLGICVGAVLGAVTSSTTRSVYAKRRVLALALARSEIDKVRALARTSTLATGSTFTSPSITGFGAAVSLQKSVSSVAGSTGVYRVSITVSWNERPNGVLRVDSLNLETYVRAPDA